MQIPICLIQDLGVEPGQSKIKHSNSPMQAVPTLKDIHRQIQKLSNRTISREICLYSGANEYLRATIYKTVRIV